MRYLRVKAKRGANPGGGTSYTYPPGYDAQKVVYGPSYETFNPSKNDKVRARTADPCEYCLIAVRDRDAAGFLGSADIVAVDEATFIREGQEDSVPATERIVNQAEVIRIAKKIVAGQPVTQAERDILDPSKPASGINQTATWTERYQAFKATFKE